MIFAILVLSGAGGEIAISYAMKQIGEVHYFTPRALFAVFKRAVLPWLWVGVALIGTGFSMLMLLSGKTSVLSFRQPH